MLNINKPYACGLRMALEEFVGFEGRNPSNEELESILWEELDVISVYTEDLVDIWKDARCPDVDTLQEYASIKDAIKGVVSAVWHECLMPQARIYLGELV